jgi:excisionase family DNA binding protein
MTASRDDAWMTADEATAYLGYRTRAALYQAVRRGIVPAHRLGARRLRFRRSELDDELGRHPSRLGDDRPSARADRS